MYTWTGSFPRLKRLKREEFRAILDAGKSTNPLQTNNPGRARVSYRSNGV
jgi:hypothetical protein